MNETSFAERLAERFAAARHQDEQRFGVEQERMRERSERLAVLERRSEQLHRELIRPRAEAAARSLEATLEHFRTPTGFLSYVRCAHSARFPATAKLALGVEWDADGTDVSLVCSVEILPILMALPGDARLTLDWEGPDELEAARWIEERIMQFLDAYLGVANDPNYQMGNLKTDPVCGMRVSLVEACGSVEHRGKRHFFCSTACRDRFSEAPELYIEGRLAVGAVGPSERPGPGS